MNKSHIIVIVGGISPHRGSEPGKGWWWARALSRYFHIHVVTQQLHVQGCQEMLAQSGEEWDFHATENFITTWKFPTGYIQYGNFLNKALEKSKEIINAYPIVGLCHIVLGSYRLLPRYDLLGIPYTLGPLGGGENSPVSYIWNRPVPLPHKLTEALRPIANNAFAWIPPLRACMRSAKLVLVTSEETQKVIKRMGARATAVVFPDAYDYPIDVENITANRVAQKATVKTEIRLLWQGRPLWWKGPDLALLAVREAIDRGGRVSLTMVGTWDNPFGRRIKELAERLRLTSHVHFVDGMPRDVFFQMIGEQHAFITPSMHDSGGIPLIEAQARGLPCLTPGLGGHRESACPEAGVSRSPQGTQDYIERVARCLVVWQNDPEIWLEESKKALSFAQQFTNERLQGYVRDLIVPAFMGKA